VIFPAACQPDRVLFSGRDDDKGDGTVPRQVAHSLPVRQPVGAENLRDQAIFVNHAPGAIAPLDPELIEIRDAVGQLP